MYVQPVRSKWELFCCVIDWLFNWVVRLLFIVVLVKLWFVLDVYDVEKKSKPSRGLIEVSLQGPKGPFFMPEKRGSR